MRNASTLVRPYTAVYDSFLSVSHLFHLPYPDEYDVRNRFLLGFWLGGVDGSVIWIQGTRVKKSKVFSKRSSIIDFHFQFKCATRRGLKA